MIGAKIIYRVNQYLSRDDIRTLRLACKEFAAVLFKLIKKIEHDKISDARDVLAINKKLNQYAGSPYIGEIRINENLPF